MTNNRPFCKECHDFHDQYYEDCHPAAIKTINELNKEVLCLEKQIAALSAPPQPCVPAVPGWYWDKCCGVWAIRNLSQMQVDYYSRPENFHLCNFCGPIKEPE